MSYIPSIFKQKNPASGKLTSVKEVLEAIPKDSWIVVQNDANCNPNGLPTPFFSRYQARKVVSAHEKFGPEGSVLLGLSIEGDYSLYPEYTAASNVVFVGSQQSAINLAVALSDADVQANRLMSAILLTRGDAEAKSGFIKPFLRNLSVQDSYVMNSKN